MSKYKAIFELADKLKAANIPFEFADRSDPAIDFEQYQIGYPIVKETTGKKRKCSIIEGDHSYGGNVDLLEIMGLLTEEEAKLDGVAGWLTVQNVFDRIQADHRKETAKRGEQNG